MSFIFSYIIGFKQSKETLVRVHAYLYINNLHLAAHHS